MQKKKIAIFASGSGSNAECIANYFKEHAGAEVSLILSNKADAFVLERAKTLNIPSFVFNKADFYDSDVVVKKLQSEKIDIVVLAGFLWLVPLSLIQAFPEKMVNIHPALLPNYGGKGMYGMKVHEAVIAAGDKKSGITIHLVNEKYDEGRHLLQAEVAIEEGDTPETLASKIHELEYKHYPEAIGMLL